MKNRKIAAYVAAVLVVVSLYLPLAVVANNVGTYTFFENGIFRSHGIAYWVNMSITWFAALVVPCFWTYKGKVKLVKYPAFALTLWFSEELYNQVHGVIVAFNQHNKLEGSLDLFAAFALGHLTYGWLVFVAGISLMFWAGFSKQNVQNNPTQKLDSQKTMAH